MIYAELSDFVRSSIAEYFGCRIVNKVDVSSRRYRGDLEYHFEFYINDGLRELKTGSAQLEVDRERKEILWRGFFPLDYCYGASRKGLGTLAHVSTLLKLLENEPEIWDYDVIHHGIDGWGRVIQLTKIGITRTDTDSFREKFESYMRKSIAYLRRIGMDMNLPDYVLQRI